VPSQCLSLEQQSLMRAQAGFSSPAHFSAAFREMFGWAPDTALAGYTRLRRRKLERVMGFEPM